MLFLMKIRIDSTLCSTECPYAYYAHCSVHQLQLTRVSSAKVVVDVYAFYFKI